MALKDMSPVGPASQSSTVADPSAEKRESLVTRLREMRLAYPDPVVIINDNTDNTDSTDDDEEQIDWPEFAAEMAIRFYVGGVYALMKDVIKEGYADMDACIAKADSMAPQIDVEDDSKETDDLVVAADILRQAVPPAFTKSWRFEGVNHPFAMWLSLQIEICFPEPEDHKD
ncbi:hypothetical protein GE09DRAFT_1065383 [Coniochaeta sp. 2T2.1]|nr:hypothetical protein GE09DRAFT_1065383 [Coniochaeta sp. 2T2.1]